MTCLHAKTVHTNVSFSILSYSVLSSYIDLQKDSTVNLNIPQTPGQHGLTSTPPRKFLTQHSPQKQENDTDQTRGQHSGLANGVVAAQGRTECEDRNATVRSPEAAIPTAETSPDTHLVNGEGNETATDSVSSITNSHDEDASDSSRRTPGADLGLPSKGGGSGMEAELPEKENGMNTMELDKLDQHHEMKVSISCLIAWEAWPSVLWSRLFHSTCEMHDSGYPHQQINHLQALGATGYYPVSEVFPFSFLWLLLVVVL